MDRYIEPEMQRYRQAESRTHTHTNRQTCVCVCVCLFVWETGDEGDRGVEGRQRIERRENGSEGERREGRERERGENRVRAGGYLVLLNVTLCYLPSAACSLVPLQHSRHERPTPCFSANRDTLLALPRCLQRKAPCLWLFCVACYFAQWREMHGLGSVSCSLISAWLCMHECLIVFFCVLCLPLLAPSFPSLPPLPWEERLCPPSEYPISSPIPFHCIYLFLFMYFIGCRLPF